jgi:DNA-directed RNA polymerase specialized sigma54-like protein
MSPVEVRQIQQVKQVPGLVNKIEIVKFVQLSEEEFAILIKEIEEAPLFKKIAFTNDKRMKVVTRERFPKSDFSKEIYELKEEIAIDKSVFDIKSVLANHKKTVILIKKMGIRKFEKYFLYNESMIPAKEISIKCNLSIKEIEKINKLINDFSIHNEFFCPTSIDHVSDISYTKVASIQENNNGDFIFAFFSPYFVRGRYEINYERLSELKRENAFSSEEKKYLNKLLHDLKLINNRKSTIYKVIEGVVEVQKEYLKSRDEEDLISFKQKDLASRINIDTGLVSRAIYGRSIVMPWGEEKPIKYLLPNEKRIRKDLIKNIISKEKSTLTDDEIRFNLQKKYGFKISRRSISDYRRELKIPSSYKRKYG